MDKELEKRQKKKENLFKRMEEVKPEQVNLVRFVDVRWEVMEVDEEGKWHHTGRDHGHGLQVENRVYMVKGPYKMVNRRTFRITKSYKGIPEWATEELKLRYRHEREARGLDKQPDQPYNNITATNGSVLQNPQLSSQELLAVLQSFPATRKHSIKSLKAYTHTDYETICRCIKELEDAGLLVKHSFENGKRRKTVYTLSASAIQPTPLSSKTKQVSEQEDDLPPW